MLEITGNRVAPGSYSAPIILWLKEHEPEVFAAAHKFLVPSGFIVHRLSGQFSMDYSRGSTTALFDIRKREWSEDLLRGRGPPREAARPLESAQVVGGVTPARRAHGPARRHAGGGRLHGHGRRGGGLGRGDAQRSFAILGTVARVAVALDSRASTTALSTAATPRPAMGGPQREQRRGRLAALVPRPLRPDGGSRGREMGSDPYDLLRPRPRRRRPGQRLIYLPYIAAERSPIWDPYARGVFFGMSVGNKRGDFVRAMMEGVALSLRHNLTIMTERRRPHRQPAAGGGCARSALWDQVIADVTGHTIVTMRASETETLGTAILAGVGTGVYASFAEARERTLALEGRVRAAGRGTRRFTTTFSTSIPDSMRTCGRASPRRRGCC